MKQFTFTTNSIVIKNNRSLKTRGQFSLEMEIDKTFWDDVKDIENIPDGVHFQVALVQIGEEPSKEREKSIYEKFREFCIMRGGEKFYEEMKEKLNVVHLRELEDRYGQEAAKEILDNEMSLHKNRPLSKKFL